MKWPCCGGVRFTHGSRVIFRLIVHQTIRFQRNGAGSRQKDTDDLTPLLNFMFRTLENFLCVVTLRGDPNSESHSCPFRLFKTSVTNFLLAFLRHTYLHTKSARHVYCLLNVSYPSLFLRAKISHVNMQFAYPYCMMFPSHGTDVVQIPSTD